VRFSAASFPDHGWTTRREGCRAGDLKYGHVDAKNIGHTYDLYGISPTRTQVTAYASVDVRVRYRDNDKIINCGPLPRWPHNPSAENRTEFLFVQNRTYARARRALAENTIPGMLPGYIVDSLMDTAKHLLFTRGNVSCIGYHAGKRAAIP